jgi:hypothetical protein
MWRVRSYGNITVTLWRCLSVVGVVTDTDVLGMKMVGRVDGGRYVGLVVVALLCGSFTNVVVANKQKPTSPFWLS